ncbi:MAG TPA: ATP-binding protein [Candidatus Thermoplasmatota archaeon]|nr:ATP-binding protein [Candidatus Thermoplasmatota archaeon]
MSVHVDIVPEPPTEAAVRAAIERAERAEAYADRIARILALVDLLSFLHHRKDVARSILEQAQLAVGATGGFVLAVERESARLELVHAEGVGSSAPASIELDADDLCALVVRRGEATYVAPARAYLGPEAGEGVLATVPLAFTGRTLGALAITWPEGAAPDETDRAFLAALAQQCALALHRVEAEETLEQARKRLAQSEKMSALGGMVSGVAHELRTPLVYLANNVELIQRVLHRGAAAGRTAAELLPEVAPMAAETTEAVDRISRLVRDLRKFEAPAPSARVMMDLRAPVAEAVRLFQVTHRTARLQLDLEHTPSVPVDPMQVQQIVINLLENATDATGPAGAPIHVATRPSFHADGGALLLVEDGGTGMSRETLLRMFDPLFTTKREGRGLGLSIVKRIVDDHGGEIECLSTQASGTRFTIRFPTTPLPRRAMPSLGPLETPAGLSAPPGAAPS